MESPYPTRGKTGRTGLDAGNRALSSCQPFTKGHIPTMNEQSVSSFRMERIMHIDGQTSYEITDDAGRTIILTPERAYEVLDWLYDLRDELHQAATGEHTSKTFTAQHRPDEDTPICKNY